MGRINQIEKNPCEFLNRSSITTVRLIITCIQIYECNRLEKRERESVCVGAHERVVLVHMPTRAVLGSPRVIYRLRDSYSLFYRYGTPIIVFKCEIITMVDNTYRVRAISQNKKKKKETEEERATMKLWLPTAQAKWLRSNGDKTAYEFHFLTGLHDGEIYFSI